MIACRHVFTKVVMKTKRKPKTIKFSEWKRLTFCNSTKLPPAVNVNGARWEWTGGGWIDVGDLKGGEPVVVDDNDRKKS